ncbi:transketolase family protein [Helcococcus kunzii]|uniref:transketolase family protein n=1 Tax=Helcococcus kunzii TaxID=40091 RepID=UPI0038A01313
MWKRSKDTKDIELRQVFVNTLDKLIMENPKILVFEADLGGASGTTKLKEKHSKQFVQVGISEANMIGMAAGASIRGYVPFVHTFSPFTTRRALDQIFIAGAYSGNTLNIYGSDPGFCAGANGGTHSTYDDISTMRNIPGTTVLAPADSVCFEWCMMEVSKIKGVNYIRGNRKANPKIYEDGSTFELGKGNILREGSDILIYTMGELVLYALEAADILDKKGIDVEVIDMFSIKPFDRDLVISETCDKKLAITFENHNVLGGLGSTVAEIMTENGISTPLHRIGVDNRFGQVGNPEDQRKDYGLTSERIVNEVIDFLKG